jgi:hypothetical protein
VYDDTPSRFDTLAQCIAKSGAKFYGAYWCPHCIDQKKEFENAARYLPYVECATNDNGGQTLICKDKKITGYPTWIFADGTRKSGEVEIKDLAEKTKCALPGNTETTTTPVAQ